MYKAWGRTLYKVLKKLPFTLSHIIFILLDKITLINSACVFCQRSLQNGFELWRIVCKMARLDRDTLWLSSNLITIWIWCYSYLYQIHQKRCFQFMLRIGHVFSENISWELSFIYIPSLLPRHCCVLLLLSRMAI